MCLLCDDEKAYAAYMNYLDAMERQGKAADPDKAVDAVLDALEAIDKARVSRDDPAHDKQNAQHVSAVRRQMVRGLAENKRRDDQ